MVRTICLALALMSMAGVASARHSDSREFARDSNSNNSYSTKFKHRHQPVSAPEIDPSSAMVGLTLMMGGLAVLRGRRSKTA
jgi:hypothetical protein